MPISRAGSYSLPKPFRNSAKLDPSFDDLLNSARHYITKGVAPSTLKAYTSAWSLFVTFCLSFRKPVFPILITTVCSFLVYNFETRNLKISSIRKLLASIQFFARYHNPDYPSLFNVPAVRLLLKGITKSSAKTHDKRLPITFSVLQQLITSLRNGSFSNYINVLLEALFLTAFYGFMRPGEFTSESKHFESSRDLSLSDVRFSPNFFTIFLKHSKNDSMGSGVSLSLYKNDYQFCPYSSMIKYLKIRLRTSLQSPLFILPNGAPITKVWFSSHLATVLKNCGLSPLQYTGHSFRIGAATTAAEHGIPTSTIKLLGRWSSSAFESYIRPEQKFISKAQQIISRRSQGDLFANTGGGEILFISPFSKIVITCGLT